MNDEVKTPFSDEKVIHHESKESDITTKGGDYVEIDKINPMNTTISLVHA